MHNMYRRLCLLLITAALLCSLPTAALAADSHTGTCGEDLTWTLSDGVLTISGTGAMNSYDDLNNRSPWRTYASEITSVCVTSGVTEISDYSFKKCTALTKAVFADSVTEIGSLSFAYCTALKEVTLPSKLNSIPYEAFIGCKSLASITIPSTVDSLGTGTFQDCKSLTHVTIPDSVQVLGDYTFYGCSSLTTVSIGSGATGLIPTAFRFTPALQAVNVSARNPHITSVNGVVYNKEMTALICHPESNGTSFTVPATITSIRARAFDVETGFAGSDSILKNIIFLGSAPIFGTGCFDGIHANAYYPASDSSWTESVRSDCSGDLTWIPYSGEAPIISEEPAEPDAPKLISVTNNYNGATLTWEASERAVNYRVLYKTAGENSWHKAGDTTDTKYVIPDEKLTSGQTICFTARPITADGKSYVGEYDRTGLSILYLSATTLTVRNTASGINIRWDPIPGAEGYYVYRKVPGGTYKRVKTLNDGSASSWTNISTALINGEAYNYAVRAYSGTTRGSYHSKNTIRVTPVAITSLTSGKAKTVIAKWEKNTASDGYQIEYSTSSAFTASTKVYVTGSTRTISDLTSGKTLYVRVRTYKKNASGTRYYSAWSSRRSVKIT